MSPTTADTAPGVVARAPHPARLALVAVEPRSADSATAALQASDLARVDHVAASPDEVADHSGELDVVVLCVGDSIEEIVQQTREAALALVAVPLVVVSLASDVRSIRAALGTGAKAYVIASEADRALAVALAGVLAGQLVAPARLREQFTSPSLSNREKQILAMLVVGLSNDQIAAKLVVTASTVKSHLSSAYRKLGVGSRSQAAAAILGPDGLGTGILRISSDEAP